MNQKIETKLLEIIKNSPQLMNNNANLNDAITMAFDVNIFLRGKFNLEATVKLIDEAVLKKYFSEVWQPKTKKYKYSGLAMVDEINALKPQFVADLGCGYNEFKGKIHNLIGVDPYNTKADITSHIVNFKPRHTLDVAICLGSINFGSVDKILQELEHVVSITNPGGKIFFRANPGKMHEAPEARWIDFFNWTPEFILNAASSLGCTVTSLREDVDRYYFVWTKE